MFPPDAKLWDKGGKVMKTKQWSPEKEINRATIGIGNWTTREIIEHRVNETIKVFEALQNALPKLEAAADIIVDRAKKGGKVITIGAGGSGVAGMSVMRELPQNHRDIDPRQFTYHVTGGPAIFQPLGCEELEDSREEGQADVEKLGISEQDVVISISATGRTPYTRGAAQAARSRGAYTMGLLCQTGTELEDEVDLPIILEIGPEMFMGATCEKAASAQKDALDAIMDAVVVRLGATDDNRTRARLVHEKARIRARFFEQTQQPVAIATIPPSHNTG
ncbi:MAG: SIS domain-containing protein [Candidatus Doudnabacteria bacterium]|nr:SIS domain-containing protein [Candidatus Doudnabacteria bacterium]